MEDTTEIIETIRRQGNLFEVVEVSKFRGFLKDSNEEVDITVVDNGKEDFVKETFNFGPRSRGRQRAFYDTLKDLAIPAAAMPPVIRIPVPDRDVETAWKSSRDRVFAAIGR